MKKKIKIVVVVFTGIGVCLLILCVWGVRMIMRSLPQTEGELIVEGVKSEVHVYRDDYHIPHVIAKNEQDLFFTQGYVTAQDRLWQMDLWRRIAEGRLSEIFGPSSLKTDSLMLTVGIKRIAQKIVPELSSDSRCVLQAYTNGINAFIDKHSDRLPIEFSLLNYKPDPWAIEDCIAVLRWLGWQLSFGWITDGVLGAIVDRVGIDKARDIFPSHHQDILPIVSWKQSNFRDQFDDVRLWQNIDVFGKSSKGSNGWVVSGDRSKTGKPILANDLHLFYFNPSLWYEIHLVGGGFDVLGLSYPGLPMVVVGHNDRIAWGITNMMADVQDLFIERFNTDDSSRYFYRGRYRSVERIEEEILLRNVSPIRIRIRKTHNGPIVSRMLPLEGVGREAFSLRWTGHDVSDEALCFYRLSRAGDWESFREALRGFEVPCLNFLYADREGNIGYQAAGKIPIRTRGVGFLPRPGEDVLYEWKGSIPFDQLPAIKNPEKGYLVSANNPIVDEHYPYFISALWDTHSRVQRIHQLLSEKETFSVADFKRMQSDVLSVYAKDVVELLISDLSTKTFNDSLEKEFIERFSRWGGQMKAGSSEAALFEVFILKLIKNIFKDEMGDSLYTSYIGLYSIPLRALFKLIMKDDSPWFDRVDTHGISEGKRDIVIQSYEEAVSYFEDLSGENVSQWTWGQLHTMVFKHPLDQHPLLGRSFDLGPFHVGGSGTTVDCKAYDLKKPFDAVWGASARMIVDLNDFDNTLSVIPTGQSGQPLDEHYKDQLQLYLGNLYHSNIVDTIKIRQSGWDHLVFKPGGFND